MVGGEAFECFVFAPEEAPRLEAHDREIRSRQSDDLLRDFTHAIGGGDGFVVSAVALEAAELSTKPLLGRTGSHWTNAKGPESIWAPCAASRRFSRSPTGRCGLSNTGHQKQSGEDYVAILSAYAAERGDAEARTKIGAALLSAAEIRKAPSGRV
jgi:hypothetical protein